MYKLTSLLFPAAIWIFSAVITSEESLGNLAQYPPLGKDITITTNVDGIPILEPKVVNLLTGKYYRLNINCPDVQDDLTGWRIEMQDLLRNSHLRLVTVGDIEIHLQGLSFNAIECDEIGSAHVSFVPIKPGNYVCMLVMSLAPLEGQWEKRAYKTMVNL